MNGIPQRELCCEHPKGRVKSCYDGHVDQEDTVCWFAGGYRSRHSIERQRERNRLREAACRWLARQYPDEFRRLMVIERQKEDEVTRKSYYRARSRASRRLAARHRREMFEYIEERRTLK